MVLMKNDRKPKDDRKTSNSRLRRLLDWIARAGDPKTLSGC
jgi:hypothetical protein